MNKRTLSNGLRVITIPLLNTRVATVLVLVKTGSKYEEKEVSGISHFLEHMLFKKTEKRPSPLKIAEDLDKVGGLYNAFTGEEYTGYYAKVNASKLPLAIDWVSDIYLNSLLPENEVLKEKGVIKEEINMRYDNPMDYSQILFANLLYGDQPAGRDIAGTKESVSNITRDDLFSYMNSQYLAKNTVVVVAGNIDEKKTEEEVVKAFSSIKEGEAKSAYPVIEEQKKPEVLFFNKKTDQTHIVLGVRTFNSSHRYRYTQKIIASILGGMMSSRLFIKIRDELGLAYYIATSAESNPDTGTLMTQAGVDNTKVKDAVEVIVEEYRKMKTEEVSEEELKKAKEHLKGKMAIILEPSDALAYFHGTTEIQEGKTYSLKEVFDNIDKVTSLDILEASKEIFREDNINLSAVGPLEDEKEFIEILKKV